MLVHPPPPILAWLDFGFESGDTSCGASDSFFALSDRRYFANGFKSWYGRIDCVRQAARTEAVATPAFS